MGRDLITMGRTGVDIYPLQSGVPLEKVQTFGKFLGGTATNVAIAAARLGRNTALITKVGRDPFGRYVHDEAERLGVDARYITAIAPRQVISGQPSELSTEPASGIAVGDWTEALAGPPTPVTFCELFPPDNFPIYFYRYPTAPDLMIDVTDLPLEEIAGARVFWATVTGLCQEPSRSAHFAAWRARDRREHTVLDLDWRPMFWPSRAEPKRVIGRALEHVTVAVGNLEECEVAVGEADPGRAADALLDRGVRLAVVKQGPRGVLAATEAERVSVAPFPVRVVNGLGAGDAFGGALVHGLLAGWDLGTIVEFANAAGAIVAGKLECSTAMPDLDEVRRVLGQYRVRR